MGELLTVGLNPFTEHATALLRQRHADPRITNDSGLLIQCHYTMTRQIADKVLKTFPVCVIEEISLVNAPQMYGMYLLRKEELQMQSSKYPNGTKVQELELFHVTSKSKGIESLKNGLDWRRTRRSKFGRGVSFSDDADYANYYANNTSRKDSRVIIICAVLVYRTWQVSKKWPGQKLIVPPDTYDTTVSSNRRVFVKYYDYEFYPLYMVHYRHRPEYIEVSRFNIRSQEQQREQQQRLRQSNQTDDCHIF